MSRISSVNRDTLIFHADSIPDTLKAKTDYRSFYSPVKIIEKAIEQSVESPLPTAPEDAEEVPSDPVEPSETADPPAEAENSETEQLIENPEPAVPTAPEDAEEVPADSTES